MSDEEKREVWVKVQDNAIHKVYVCTEHPYGVLVEDWVSGIPLHYNVPYCNILTAKAPDEQVRELESENTTLCKKLDKAVKMPFEIGTTVFIVKEKNFLWKETHIAVGKITLYLFDGERLSIRVAGSYPDHDFEFTVYQKDYNKTWFTDRASAEKRLKELKEGREE